MKVKLEEEEKERAVLRVVARKERDQFMRIRDMEEDEDEEDRDSLVRHLPAVGEGGKGLMMIGPIP